MPWVIAGATHDLAAHQPETKQLGLHMKGLKCGSTQA